MTGAGRGAIFRMLEASSAALAAWEPEPPNPAAERCEFSRHRTLAHLRACQEQWLAVATEFLNRDSPNVTILHPWRKFAAEGYANLEWESHMNRFKTDRAIWLQLLEEADWSRGGRMNRKPESIGSLARRLAEHERYHIEVLGARLQKSRQKLAQGKR